MKPSPAIELGITVALAAAILLAGGLIFREEVLEFIHSITSRPAKGVIEFGKALDPSGRAVLNPATAFRIGENVAWVVRFENGAQTKEMVAALFEVMDDGRELPLDRNKMTVEPTDEGVYNFTQAEAFWSLSLKNPGADRHTYRVKYLIADRVAAQGDFTIVKSAEDQPSPDEPIRTP